MKKLFVLMYIFLLASISFAEYTQERSVESSKIWNEIDALEKQKPLVKAVISYCENQLPIVSEMKKKVEDYSKTVEIAYKSNAIKTVISGSLALANEVVGGISGKSLLDLGLWVTNKGISVAMGDSDTFGGVASYKRKMSGFLASHSNLTTELSKLHSISATSDSAIKAYYSKYGKYSDMFELGDTGIFTTRMRLIIEQSVLAIASLENLRYKLYLELDDSQLTLRRIERTLTQLKSKLAELNNKQKEEKIEEIKSQLTTEEENKGKVLSLKPSIYINNEVNCDTAALRLESLSKQYIAVVTELNEKTIELNDIRKNYYDGIIAKFEEFSNKKSDFLKKTPSPNGYETPLAKILSVTQNWYDANLVAEDQLIADYESLTSTLVENIPGEELLKTVSQITANKNFIYSSGYNLKYGPCFDITDAMSARSFGDKNIKIVSIVNYPAMIKDTKISYLKSIDKKKKMNKIMKSFYEKSIRQMRIDHKETRLRMQEDIAIYEKAVQRNREYTNNLIADMNELESLYNSGLFKIKNQKFGKYYQLNFELDYSKNICEVLNEIKTKLHSSNIQNILALKSKIDSALNSITMYSIPEMPKAAYKEFGKDTKAISKAQVPLKESFRIARDIYRDNGSDVYFLINTVNNMKFYSVPQFVPFYEKLTKNVSIIKSLVRNLKSEVNNALAREIVPYQTYANYNKYYERLVDRYKNELSCFPLNYELIEGIVEDIDEIKELLTKLKSKKTYIDVTTMTASIEKLQNEIKIFYMGSGDEYKNKYANLSSRYKEFDKKVNEVYIETINPTDRSNLNKILSKIKGRLLIHEDNINVLGTSDAMQSIEDFYVKFKNSYSNKDVNSLMSYIDDDWISSSDRTTLMDLEDTLDNSFSIFDEVKCEIYSLNINKLDKNKYVVNYVISITGYIYDEDIEHIEKSSVSEEVRIEDGVVKILKTLNGQYWKTR